MKKSKKKPPVYKSKSAQTPTPLPQPLEEIINEIKDDIRATFLGYKQGTELSIPQSQPRT